MHLLYLHGFNSSPDSTKAQITKKWLAEHHPDIEFICPFQSPYPQQAAQQILEVSRDLDWTKTMAVGSSMGGFWTTWLVEKFGCKGVLINPAVRPWEAEDHLSGEQTNYNTGDTHVLTLDDVAGYQAFGVSGIKQPDRYWVLLQTGDEVIDYRIAEEFYRGAKVTVEEGGDHGFVGFERFLEPMISFWKQ